ncbi:uncharacterized protein MAM_07250 [Metarhizium album ARSEF 1941]|uniref:Uncharacterized protein n=1 Tax=Metarhizium album (strain ARSEF 1941) TaxID=1081103 RepID=A0A0B2WFV1_METAS|nr:uncharacterized protein MAM_07250 [Metarhizium album ARSEF 1941]KHN94831.1 hypothetical protein MAM_07250 [Metarhizium album ARSEF 1941]
MATQNATSQSPSDPCVIISGFVAIGKTWLTENASSAGLYDYNILDLDSAQFPKDADGRRGPEFKPAYLAKVKESIAPNTIILVSTHVEIRTALVEQGLNYALVYPSDHLKEEWISRLQEREETEKLVQVVQNLWPDMMDGCKSQSSCQHFVLGEGQYLSDIIGDIIRHVKPIKDQRQGVQAGNRPTTPHGDI